MIAFSLPPQYIDTDTQTDIIHLAQCEIHSYWQVWIRIHIVLKQVKELLVLTIKK